MERIARYYLTNHQQADRISFSLTVTLCFWVGWGKKTTMTSEFITKVIALILVRREEKHLG